MTTLYYAPGSGFGHVTRAHRVLAALGIEATIATTLVDCDRLIADAFPGGIAGELCGLDVPMDYVARLLRWDEYRRAVPGELPHFGTTWIVEELTPEHDAFMRAHSERVEWLDLPVGQTLLSVRKDRTDKSVCLTQDFTLVVHSGPAEEVRELVAYAAELDPGARIVVASPHGVDGYERIDAYPASDLFPAATRIVSAAGFNVMLETQCWREKHVVMPFPRKFDDQFTRAARRRQTTPRRTDTTAPPLRSPRCG